MAIINTTMNTSKGKIRKVLVTGGLGLIGSHIVRRAIKEGCYVRVIDNRVPDRETLAYFKEHSVFFILGDISNRSDVAQAVDGMDAIFHTAAIARTMETVGDPIRAHAVNATGTLLLLEAARKFGIKRFVHSSSSILYVPETPYFVGKQCAESSVSVWAKLFGLSTISLRYANVYGPGQRQDGAYPNVLAAFAKRWKEDGTILVDGKGDQNRSFIHVDDVVDANWLALVSSQTGVFDIGTDEYTTIEEISDWFSEVTGCVVTHGPAREGDVFTIPISTREAFEVLGFKAKVIFNKEAIKSYL